MYFPPLDEAYPVDRSFAPENLFDDVEPVNNMHPHPHPRTQIPNLPLLGNLTHEQLVQTVLKAIIGEATAVDLYGRLLKEAPNAMQKSFIEDALMDEQKHLEAFRKLYMFLTGSMPQYRIHPVQYKTYREGLLYAMKDELEAHSFYGSVTLSTSDHLVKDTFTFAMNDEIEHALTFSFCLTYSHSKN